MVQGLGERGSVAVYIDGEGIPPRHIRDHLRLLPEGGATISVRRNPDWGIGHERKLAEMFELWLVSRIFNVDPLPDGQCGLWSLSWEAANVIDLRARTFEVELDLLTELLLNKVPLRFVDVEVEPADGTTFRKEDHRKKLLFLAAKFKLSPDAVMREFEGFSRINGSPPELRRAVEDVVSLIREVRGYDAVYSKDPPLFDRSSSLRAIS